MYIPQDSPLVLHLPTSWRRPKVLNLSSPNFTNQWEVKESVETIWLSVILRIETKQVQPLHIVALGMEIGSTSAHAQTEPDLAPSTSHQMDSRSLTSNHASTTQ